MNVNLTGSVANTAYTFNYSACSNKHHCYLNGAQSGKPNYTAMAVISHIYSGTGLPACEMYAYWNQSIVPTYIETSTSGSYGESQFNHFYSNIITQ